MRKIILGQTAYAALCLMLTSCHSEPEGTYVYEELPEERSERIAAAAREEAELSAVDYPVCDNVWSNERLSDCGRERLAKALTICAEKEGEGSRLDPLSAGDSWITRAGRNSMQTTEERAQRIFESEKTSETISYALGDGTNRIKLVSCSLDAEMKLVGVFSTIT